MIASKKNVGVVISGWLERKRGKCLMGKGDKRIIRHYVRRGEKLELKKAAPTVSLGFEIEGKFIV